MRSKSRKLPLPILIACTPNSTGRGSSDSGGSESRSGSSGNGDRHRSGGSGISEAVLVDASSGGNEEARCTQCGRSQ